MRHLLNTLFVTSEDIYLTLDGGKHSRQSGQDGHCPVSATYTVGDYLVLLSRRVSSSYGRLCAAWYCAIVFARRADGFLARVTGEANGNVLLRRAQYRAADDPNQSCRIARTMIFGKIHNGRWSVERHPAEIMHFVWTLNA